MAVTFFNGDEELLVFDPAVLLRELIGGRQWRWLPAHLKSGLPDLRRKRGIISAFCSARSCRGSSMLLVRVDEWPNGDIGASRWWPLAL